MTSTHTFKLEIVLPETPLPARNVSSIDVPAADGRLTVLANHQPLIAALAKGLMIVTDKDGQTTTFEISAGALQVDNNVATILVSELNEKTK